METARAPTQQPPARADASEKSDDKAAALVEARRWNHKDSALKDRARSLAAQYDEKGDAARESKRLQKAYDAYAMALALDPRLSWTRRKAEDVRDERLKITRPGRKKAKKKPKKG